MRRLRSSSCDAMLIMWQPSFGERPLSLPTRPGLANSMIRFDSIDLLI